MQERKRVVSYSQYLAYLFGKEVLLWSEFLLYGASMFCGIASVGLGIAWASWMFSPSDAIHSEAIFWSAIVSGFGAWALFRVGDSAGQKSTKMEPILPPTRHNIERLPSEETLVRASQEPTIGQEKVLLRAAQSSEEVKQEELLRATLESK